VILFIPVAQYHKNNFWSLFSALVIEQGQMLARVIPRKGGNVIEMREYEVAVILKPGLEDSERAQLLERVEGWLTNGEEEQNKPEADHWGQRSLAYPINKHTEGYYIFYTAKLEPSQVREFERNVVFVEEILRYLVIRKEQ
jgi:small subunit ribosomal protein S6